MKNEILFYVIDGKTGTNFSCKGKFDAIKKVMKELESGVFSITIEKTKPTLDSE